MAPALSAPLVSLLPLLPLGLAAGVLSGLLGIGGGLIFSPLLLMVGLEPHQALATSTLAIVPTTFGGTWAHARSGDLSAREGVAVAAGAAGSAALWSHLGAGLAGWLLLALQAAMYGLLAVTVHAGEREGEGSGEKEPLAALAAVGGVAGVASGLLGVGGGLVMVPVLVRLLKVPIHRAIRLSTLAVLASAATASLAFLGDGRARLGMAVALGGTAALAARWAAARLSRLRGSQLAWMLRALILVLAVDSGRRALILLLAR